MWWLLTFGFFLGALNTHELVQKGLILLCVLSLCIGIHAEIRKR
jgi:hypothetical protein